MKVLVGMTGGPDSTVAAFLLKKQGYECYGAAIITIDRLSIGEQITQLRRRKFDDMGMVEQEMNAGRRQVSPTEFLDNVCTVDKLDVVQEICQHLDIPFFGINIRSEFEACVIDPLVASKIEGRGFSPCIWCNTLKLKVLFDRAQKLKMDYVATGHFAKIHKEQRTHTHQIFKSNDADYDQSHLLARLDSQYLEKLILPLSELRRTDVLKLITQIKSDIQEHRDSRKACFKGEGLSEFISVRANSSFLKDGPILVEKTGLQIGEHQGMHHFSQGDVVNEQKEGVRSMGINNDLDYRVTGFNSYHSQVLVGKDKDLFHRSCEVNQLYLNSGIDLTRPQQVYVHYGDHTDTFPASLFFKNNQNAMLLFTEELDDLHRGKEITIFNSNKRGAKVLGSGFIGDTSDFHPLGIKKKVDISQMDADELSLLNEEDAAEDTEAKERNKNF